METQTQPPQENQPSNQKWIVLAIGGGCAFIACLAIAAALVLCLGPWKLCGSVPLLPPTIPSSSPSVLITEIPAAGASHVVIPPGRDHPQEEGNKMGDPNAPVKIVEYADFQCPFCLRYWQETEPLIIQNYVATGKVYYEYRSVGGFIGPESADAANAAYCAGDQNKFWEYHDMLFANWTGENAGDFTPDKLRQYAAAIQLNMDQFNTCLNSGSHSDQVSQDARDAKAAGVQGTPSFLINGKLTVGAQPYPTFQQTIDAALNGQ